jgi:hypothetical protein
VRKPSWAGSVRRARAQTISVVAVLGGLLVGVPPAAAADFELTLPAGTACPGFALHIAGSGGNYATRSFVNGRTVSAGTGFALEFTNVSTGETFTTKSNGAAQQTITNPDGTETVMSVGHRVIVLFPSDSPAGPSTTLIVGRIVYDVDEFGNFTVRSVKGNTTDICALLS